MSGRDWAQVPRDHHSPGPFKPIILFVLISNPKWAPSFLFWVLHPACHGQEGQMGELCFLQVHMDRGEEGQVLGSPGANGRQETRVLPVCQGEMYHCRQLGRENRGLGSWASSVAFVPCD